MQNQLLSSLNFRLFAVKRVVSNREKFILEEGVANNDLLISLKTKISLVIFLRDLSQYLSEVVVRLGILYKKRKRCSVDLLVIQDQCVQSLFNLVIEPVTEVKADIHSFGFRRGRSAHQALAVLRANLKSDVGGESTAIFDVEIDNFFGNVSFS